MLLESTRIFYTAERITNAGSAFHYAVTSSGRLYSPRAPYFNIPPRVDTTAAAIPPTPSILTIRIHLVNTKCTFPMRHVFTLYCFYLGTDRAALATLLAAQRFHRGGPELWN